MFVRMWSTVILLGVAACGSSESGESTAAGGSTGSGGSSNEFFRLYCEAEAEREARCGSGDGSSETCIASSDEMCNVTELYHPDVIAARTTCWEGACETDCSLTELGYEPTDVAAAYSADCEDKRTACGGGFDDKLCFAALFARDEVIELWRPCLDVDCEEVGACLTSSFSCD